MSLQKYVHQWSGFVGVAIVVYGALATATAFVCWLGGVRTWSDFSMGLIVLGGIALLVGVIAGKGIRDARVASAQTAAVQGSLWRAADSSSGLNTSRYRPHIDRQDLKRASRLLYSIALAGILTLASGVLIRTL